MNNKKKQAKSIEDIEKSININWVESIDEKGKKVFYGSYGMVEFKINVAGLYHRTLYTLSNHKRIYIYKPNSKAPIEQRIQELKDGARNFIARIIWSILNESKKNEQ